MVVRYPAGPITPHGWWHLVKGIHPVMKLTAYDGSVEFYLMGGHAIPDRVNAPEAVHIPRDGLKGLIPPWRHIDQKGATEDGVTHIDALYDPIEVELKVVCKGRDAVHTRRVVRDLIASIDAKQESELSWLTLDQGYWWAPVRWFKGAPPDPLIGAQNNTQPLTLRLRADSGFWRSFDHTDTFQFAYESMLDTFATDHSDDENLGPDWPQYYTGSGDGYCSTTSSPFEQARWYESGNEEREVVNGPYKDFHTETDNQVVEMVLGSLPEIRFLGGAYNDLWGRMGRNPDGSWNGDGVRARIGMQGLLGWIKLSKFHNFAETTMFERVMLIPPLFGEKFTLVCGDSSNPRLFKVLRNGLPILTHKETGANLSEMGSNHRGVGFGMAAGAGVLSQRSPAWVRKVSAGDNAEVTQSGFLQRVNIGDQPMYDDYTIFGPASSVRIWDGPGSDEFVEFGPILANQIVFLRTDPRSRTTLVQDLTVVPPSPQELNIFQQAVKAFSSFAFGNNVPPLMRTIESLFGIRPPQGNLYKYLKGRFSERAAIPPKSPGNPAKPYYVRVEIQGGNADSKIIASGTPLRRWPL